MPHSRYTNHLDTLIAAIAGHFAVYLFTKYSGIGISPDSIMYVSTAESIFKHGNLITFNGTPMVFFPVFYPAFLSTVFIFCSNVVAAGPVINGLLFAAVIFLSGWMVSKFQSPSRVYKLLMLAAIVLSPALLEIYTYLWSETLFVLTTLIFIWAFRQYLLKHNIKTLLIAALAAAICCLTRYAGVTVIVTGGLLILLDNRLIIRKKITHILLFGVAGISLLVINLIVNAASTGYATGTRKPSVTPFSENLYYFATVLCNWLGLTEQAYPYGKALAVVILLTIIIWLIWHTLKSKLNSYETVFTAFAIVYSLFILIIATVSRFEQISSRLLSPLFIPLLIACTCWVPGVLKRINIKNRIWMAVPAVVLMLGFLYNILLIDLKRYDDEFDYGVPGYTDDDWNKSDFVVFLQIHKDIYKPGVPIYSDADEAVYFFSGMKAKLLPQRYFKSDVAKFYSEKHFYIVWFKALAHPELIGLDDIEKVRKLKKLYELEDGAVYEASPRPSPKERE
ncbi:MAG: hypothetical protein ABIP28_01540 [Mucilaginibacter sp.]